MEMCIYEDSRAMPSETHSQWCTVPCCCSLVVTVWRCRPVLSPLQDDKGENMTVAELVPPKCVTSALTRSKCVTAEQAISRLGAQGNKMLELSQSACGSTNLHSSNCEDVSFLQGIVGEGYDCILDQISQAKPDDSTFIGNPEDYQLSSYFSGFIFPINAGGGALTASKATLTAQSARALLN